MKERPLRILILINGAQEHRPFYAKVGADLLARGHDVQYCLDSHYTDFLYPDAKLPADRVHYFSDYFRENEHRRELPRELSDLPAWRMAFPDVDRLMYTRFGRGAGDARYFESYLANLGHFFVDLFDRYTFDAVVYENVSNTLSYFAYEVAQRRGARYIGFVPSRIPGRLDVLDYRFARDTRLATVFEELRRGRRTIGPDVRAFVDDYLTHFDEKVPDYVATLHPFSMSLWQRYAQTRSLQRFTRSVAYRFKAREDLRHTQLADPLYVFPEQFALEAWKHVKRRWLERLYVKAPDLTAKYFLYPLQFHPESSSSVDGYGFPHEWANVTGIARNLPFGMRLYVKDHKHAAGREAYGFYEKVARIPNVVLVHPDVDAKVLMRRAQAVVVTTTTMGYEACVLGKPVFVLGHPFYDFFPSCVSLSTFDGAHEQFAKYDSIRVARADIECLVAAYYLTSTDGMLDVLVQYDDPKATRWIADVVEGSARDHVLRDTPRQAP